jgi:hypothetical protein
MTKDIDFGKMKSELINIYEAFLKNPNDALAKAKAMDFETEYAGATTLGDYFAGLHFPKTISKAIYNLQRIWQYGMEKSMDNKNPLAECKKVIEELKKFNPKKAQKIIEEKWKKH